MNGFFSHFPLRFKIKKSLRQVLKGRVRGKVVTSDFYQKEMPDHVLVGVESAKEMAFFYTLIAFFFSFSLKLFFLFSLAFCLWKVIYSGFMGWKKLEKLHRTIEEERWEIEHHFDQEKKELEKLYSAKGFSGELLEELVAVLMSDNNRLLQIMLEEEMGLMLGSYEHPLKQAFGAFVGVGISAVFLFLGTLIFPPYGVVIASFLVIILAEIVAKKYERRSITASVIWNLSLLLLISSISYFVKV